MREIKFRTWNEVEEKMYSWYDFLNTNMKNTFIAPESTAMILMQYTGLKDKNGKEIYKGDIVQQFNVKANGVIKYKYGQFGISGLNMFWNIHPTKLEVIGNIYENPELLEDKE